MTDEEARQALLMAMSVIYCEVGHASPWECSQCHHWSLIEDAVLAYANVIIRRGLKVDRDAGTIL